ncbi:MAG TPA: YkgJ family cysteine cluster protein [Tepidisphaeraceae bacterium]|nr:YkgJ family cysteine cluster protein [Tepidisphaeraceae bacterium]
MRHLTPAQAAELRDAVAHAAKVEALAPRLMAVYRAFQHELDQRKPRCEQSGKCCRFDEYGHLLFVTTAELAVFRESLVAEERAGGNESPDKPQGRLALLAAGEVGRTANPGGACRYQSRNLCTVHSIRPFGCRVFFCDTTAAGWQETQYQRFHAQIKLLHEELGIQYLYVEWRQGLMAIESL